MRMTKYNRARLFVTGLFGLSVIASGIQYVRAEGDLGTHLFFIFCTCILGLRAVYCYLRGI